MSEAVTVQETLQPYLARLAEKGIDVTPSPPGPSSGRETAEDYAERLALQAANRAKRWNARLPAMFTDAQLADVESKPVTGWLDTDRLTLILAGSVGTGKTHAAYAVGNAAVDRGIWAEAWAVVDLLDDLRPGRERFAQATARECELLVLDDLTIGNVTPWEIEQLTAILDARIREGRRQVVTTNVSADKLAEAWQERLMDRLLFRMTPVKMTGESRRRSAW